VSVWVLAGAPAVVALIAMGKLPSGVLGDVEMLKVTETGLPFVGNSEAAGSNWQVEPAGKFEQESDTDPLKLPEAETEREADALVPPGVTLTLAGEGAPREKSTMCKVSKKS
jgi:hypothetical protein